MNKFADFLTRTNNWDKLSNLELKCKIFTADIYKCYHDSSIYLTLSFFYPDGGEKRKNMNFKSFILNFNVDNWKFYSKSHNPICLDISVNKVHMKYMPSSISFSFCQMWSNPPMTNKLIFVFNWKSERQFEIKKNMFKFSKLVSSSYDEISRDISCFQLQLSSATWQN